LVRTVGAIFGFDYVPLEGGVHPPK